MILSLRATSPSREQSKLMLILSLFDLSLLKYYFSSGKPPCVHLTVKVMRAAHIGSEVAAAAAVAVDVQPTAAPAATETAAMAPADKVCSRVRNSSVLERVK